MKFQKSLKPWLKIFLVTPIYNKHDSKVSNKGVRLFNKYTIILLFPSRVNKGMDDHSLESDGRIWR